MGGFVPGGPERSRIGKIHPTVDEISARTRNLVQINRPVPYPKSRQMALREISGPDGGIASFARDMVIALIVGFLFGAFSIPVLINLGINLRVPLLLLPAITAALSAIALLAAHQFARRVPSIFQFAKFAEVGALNSSIDFGILNSLILITGVVSGAEFLAFKSASVTLGVINSYIWNKYWTFEAPRSRGVQREFGAFLLVNLVGVGLNVAAAHVIVNVVGAPPGISTKLWANIGAVFGAGFTLFTNFFGYKFFVFRKPLVVR